VVIPATVAAMVLAASAWWAVSRGADGLFAEFAEVVVPLGIAGAAYGLILVRRDLPEMRVIVGRLATIRAR
jgi:hypothetical protein